MILCRYTDFSWRTPGVLCRDWRLRGLWCLRRWRAQPGCAIHCKKVCNVLLCTCLRTTWHIRKRSDQNNIKNCAQEQLIILLLKKNVVVREYFGHEFNLCHDRSQSYTRATASCRYVGHQAGTRATTHANNTIADIPNDPVFGTRSLGWKHRDMHPATTRI